MKVPRQGSDVATGTYTPPCILTILIAACGFHNQSRTEFRAGDIQSPGHWLAHVVCTQT